jgi:hypothetical protein
MRGLREPRERTDRARDIKGLAEMKTVAVSLARPSMEDSGWKEAAEADFDPHDLPRTRRGHHEARAIRPSVYSRPKFPAACSLTVCKVHKHKARERNEGDCRHTQRGKEQRPTVGCKKSASARALESRQINKSQANPRR